MLALIITNFVSNKRITVFLNGIKNKIVVRTYAKLPTTYNIYYLSLLDQQQI